ncbi:MAG: trp operon repressor [Sphaerochaeta sp.]|jgi:TrpR family trp operon transcriptional repressor|nr:trp operon repressor [Sphaerochaeta sp.]MCH3920010.1 trp operon repressor [Sphaerochaeta sp.]MCI2097028.1 trp operon repressor [Sphaerochaeta sp.]MCI2103834.1 trp operon repressor [Sphaerochaeta sp.]MCI2128001.1 trp operon repressor [Sphaerochaeta sp.]
MENAMDDLIRLFAKTTNEQEMYKLFDELFTQAEQKDFALRWNLLQELYQGTPQREIAKKYHISLCKITRGSRILKQPNSFFKKILSDRFDDHLHL